MFSREVQNYDIHCARFSFIIKKTFSVLDKTEKNQLRFFFFSSVKSINWPFILSFNRFFGCEERFFPGEEMKTLSRFFTAEVTRK